MVKLQLKKKKHIKYFLKGGLDQHFLVAAFYGHKRYSEATNNMVFYFTNTCLYILKV